MRELCPHTNGLKFMVDTMQIDWIKIPAGDFIYGYDEIATISNDFLIAKTPITYAQYKIFTDANPDHPIPQNWDSESRTFKISLKKHPVVFITYAMAEAFCSWAGCRLPSEEEWEKAARGDNGNIYPWGDKMPPNPYEYANFNKRGLTLPVDNHLKGASPYGVLEMAGNVYEWTTGWYNANNILRVGRGGYFGSSQTHITTRSRKNLHPDFESKAIGFRPVKDV